MFRLRKQAEMPTPEDALPGRSQAIVQPGEHSVLRTSMAPPFPEGSEQIVFGLGCFWGAERRFWLMPGVHTTAVGYCAGYTPNPTYEEVCTGLTGHNEVVLVVYFPQQVSLDELLKQFWESHDPTQGMRQGNDTGTQYRSGVYFVNEEQKQLAVKSRTTFQQALTAGGMASDITTEIVALGEFYYAEEYHQQYLHKNPHGYCGIGGTGVSCPVGLGV